MKAFRYIFAAVLFVTLVKADVLGSSTAMAPGKVETQRLSWKGRSIKIAISSSLTQPNSNIKLNSDVLGSLKRSLEVWENVADIQFQLETSDKQSLSPSGVAGDGVSLITIAQTPDNVLLFSKNFNAESAKTRVFYNGKSFITEADIVLNPFQQFSTDGTFGTFDLQATLTHELGHLLGLRHSNVLGATMTDSLSRNGTFGLADFGSRTLAASDIAAVRDIYGTRENEEECCAAITGRLTLTATRGAKGMSVWAEEMETGRVIAQSETSVDGSFRFGGLPAATYSIFWQKADDNGSAGELEPVVLKKGETRNIEEKITLRRSDLKLRYVGVNSQLTDFAVPVSAGREYVIYLGGEKLDPKNIKIEFNSPFFEVAAGSFAAQDFGEEVSVVSFVLTVADGVPAGVYSIFATGRDGSRASLIGALSVE